MLLRGRGDAADHLVGRDLFEQIRQRGRIADMIAGHLERTNLQRSFVYPDVYLAPT